jgi:protein TonB
MQRISVGGKMQAEKLTHQVKPVYRPRAKAAGVPGPVILNAIIAKDGTIERLSTVSGQPGPVRAAMDAIKQWVYQTTLLNGKPVEVATTISVKSTSQ